MDGSVMLSRLEPRSQLSCDHPIISGRSAPCDLGNVSPPLDAVVDTRECKQRESSTDLKVGITLCP